MSFEVDVRVPDISISLAQLSDRAYFLCDKQFLRVVVILCSSLLLYPLLTGILDSYTCCNVASVIKQVSPIVY